MLFSHNFIIKVEPQKELNIKTSTMNIQVKCELWLTLGMNSWTWYFFFQNVTILNIKVVMKSYLYLLFPIIICRNT
jgi:hypothetical protein